ncbi:MAG: hypothetical protein GQ525_10380 [Draconibacterium sp.]|nr:hypothetical protein [Draconibacterium sp.]
MNNNKTKNRPPFLSALCILTFVGSGFGFIAYIMASLFFDKTSALIIKYPSWHSVEAISPIYFTILMALFAFSLTGAIRMWKFHRDGFFIYLFSQIIILFLPSLWINWNAFSVVNVIFTAIFIFGYGWNWKSLKI